jgi:hypothetical protein
MRTCSCGDSAEDGRDRCARCAALETFGLDSTATADQIKEAYRTLVKVWHPDRFQGDPKLKEAADARLKAINTAYVFLTSKAGERAARPPRPGSRTSARPGARATRRPFFAFRMPSLTKLLGLAVLACGLLIGLLFVKAVDSYLAAQPVTGRYYSEVRDGILADFHAAARGLWGQTGQSLQSLVPQRSAPASALAAQIADAAQPETAAPARPQGLHRRELGAAHPEVVRLTPYITTGLTQDEVKAILGAPSVAADDKLTYGASELDFTHGKLAGWKIDPASAPIRVKLWPDAPVDPDLTFFAVGSSKSAVVVVQGTPTYLSDNQFGYGGSIVYFQNNRVVSWKNDPATVPLRVEP